MPSLAEESLRKYRATTFGLLPGMNLKNLEGAIDFVDQRGFITLWPIKGIDLPSMWTAVAGNRSVAKDHNDTGHITWGWKDEMLDKRRWYYGKLLRRKATFVSLEFIPYFYALSERVADIDDYRTIYEGGRLTREARVVADVLLNNGAQNTIQLRRLAHLSSRNSKARFTKALSDLQQGLWIVPVGVARAGGWRYAFIYQLFDRWLPEIAGQAASISRSVARSNLTQKYVESVGATTPEDIRKLSVGKSPKFSPLWLSLNKPGNYFLWQITAGRQ